MLDIHRHASVNKIPRPDCMHLACTVGAGDESYEHLLIENLVERGLGTTKSGTDGFSTFGIEPFLKPISSVCPALPLSIPRSIAGGCVFAAQILALQDFIVEIDADVTITDVSEHVEVVVQVELHGEKAKVFVVVVKFAQGPASKFSLEVADVRVCGEHEEHPAATRCGVVVKRCK